MADPPNARSQLQSLLNDLPETELQQWLEALQSNSTQINLGNAKGYQVKVTGGTAYIGDLHLGTEALKTGLRDLLQDRRSAEPTGIPQNLPRSGVVKFVGRDEDLNRLHVELKQSDRLAITAVQGMGGIGKTELALQYARTHCRAGSYPGGLCWLRAREDVGAQILSFVRSQLDLTPPEDLELVEKVRWGWVRWRAGDALLIFDDVQQYEDIAPFLPPQDSRFKVLLTTRSRFGSPVQELQLDVLSEAKALELLQTLVDRDRQDLRGFQNLGSLENLGGLETAQQICAWLGYLPLGVELVGRYWARKPDLAITELWQRLQAKRLDAIAFKQAEPGMTASLGVAAAFELSWQALDESAQQLAAVLSLFALVEIPWRLVEQCLPESDVEELEEIRDQVLLGANLLKRVDQGMYQLHQLLREFFAAKRQQRTDDPDLQHRFYQVVIAEAERVEEKPEKSFIQESTIMIAHLQATMERLASPEQALDLATCLNWIAELYNSQGRYGEAEPLYLRSLSIREQQLGSDHPDVATSLNNLANLYESQGRCGEAEPLYERSLTIREEQLGGDHPDVAASLNNLANLYHSQGRYEEAEPLYEQSLSIWEQQLGSDHPDVATSLNNLAFLYFSQGRYSEAEPLYERSLLIREQQLGTDHPAVASSLHTLAFLYHSQGRYEEAEPLFVRSLSMSEQQFGGMHPNVAATLNALAFLYNAQGRYGEAEPLLVRSLSIQEQQLGINHPDVVYSLSGLATLHRSQGRYDEAELLLLRSVRIVQAQLSGDNPLLGNVLNNLAHLYDLQGRYREAEALYLQALPILSAKLEESHTWRQKASQRFRSFLKNALQAQRTAELSDDLMTQGVLRELREAEGLGAIGKVE